MAITADKFGYGVEQIDETTKRAQGIAKDHMHVWNRLVENKSPIGLKKDEQQWEARMQQLMDNGAFNTFLSSKTIQEIEFDSNILTNGGSANADITPETERDNISFEIIGRVQDPQSRCSQLKKDIYVYSFCLEPEEHQPSGTCNFSRIDSAKLILSSSSKISNIYAVNYNVLRIMSGMAGLAYSS